MDNLKIFPRNFIVLLLLLSMLISCNPKVKDAGPGQERLSEMVTDTAFRETYRPQFHFSPASGWMNDPNGLVYHEGTYHLFYQYYPEDIVWGPMHWGHATSTDLLHWKHKGIKLYPDEHGYIFSGSAVVDHLNSSGLGSADVPPLVAIYTYHDAEAAEDGKTDYQTQGIAYSLDNGDTWKKYKDNPVLKNPGVIDFRDPKVRWHEPSGKWIMSLAVGDHIAFFGSPNLIQWDKLSEFGREMGAHGGVWECPDLIPMPLEGTGEEKWVLLVSINPGGPNGGSATQYFVGSFDGVEFVADDDQIRWLDHGTDNYAGVTFGNVPEENIVFLGWMSNWDYGQVTPTRTWRSSMTLPRKLSLIRDDDNYYLRNEPVENFESLVSDRYHVDSLVVIKEKKIRRGNIDAAEIQFETYLNTEFSVELSNDSLQKVTLHIDPATEQISFDRSKSGLTDFSQKFADKIHILPFKVSEQMTDFRIVIDRSSLEIFIDGGRYVMTEQVFPTRPYNEISFTTGEKLVVRSFNINEIKSIWNHE